MEKIDDIIRRYAEVKDPVEGFGPWILSEQDSSEKEEALSRLWRRLEATPAVDNAFLRRAKLSSLMKRIPREENGSSGSRWVWMLPVVTAAALGLLLLLRHTGEDRSMSNSDQPLAQVVDASEPPEESLGVKILGLAPILEQVSPCLSSAKVPTHSSSRSAIIAEDGRSELLVPIEGSEVDSEETLVSECEKESPLSRLSSEVSTDDPLMCFKEDKAAVAAQWAELERQDRQEGQKKNRSLSVGLQSSGGLLASASSRSRTLIQGQLTGLGDNWNVSGSQFTGFSSGTELEEKTRYDVPLRAGVTIFLPLNERVSIGAGLAFTLLHFSSTLSSSSSSMYKDTRYRYLGIPLTLRCRLFSGEWGSLYGTAGVEADCLLKGWSTVRIMDNEPTVSTFSEHPLQFSARFGAGYEYNIFRHWGIYAEASMDYYFKNNSTLDSYYMQQPLAPTVTLGIHYTLSR